MKRALLPALSLLAACGLQPVYSSGSSGAAATLLSGIEVPEIPERAGYLVRQALLDRMDGSAGGAYRLEVRLDDQISGLGVRGDDSISRERRELRARWQLVESASGKVVIDAAARSDAGIDVVDSEYAVLAAETAALERLALDIAVQITARIALHAGSQAKP